MERLDYLWLEEPLPDEASGALAELTRALDIPVIGGEVLAKHPYSLADYCARRVVDGLRADVSWTGGVTGTLKTAHLAEAFHMPSASCIRRSSPAGTRQPASGGRGAELRLVRGALADGSFRFGLTDALPITNGVAHLPTTLGLGATLDFDAIENATLEVF